MSSTEDTPDTETILQKVAQKLSGENDTDDESTDSADAGQKGDDPDADAEQKQDPDEADVMEDLVAALAEHMNAEPEEVRAALDSVGQNADDEDMEDDDDDVEVNVNGDDEEDGKTSGGEVNIDFGAKADEHGLLDEETLGEKLDERGFVTEDELGEKLDTFQESIVEDLGEKLADANEEAVSEIAQKMYTGQTPDAAGGSFQDEKDFESELERIANKEEW